MRNTFAFCAALCIATIGTTRAQAQSCRAADMTSSIMVATLQNTMTSTVPQVIAERQSSHLPVAAVDSITFVTDTTVCSQMASAYAAALAPSSGTPSGSVYVVKVGAVYVVCDPAITHFGEWSYQMVIDRQGKVLARYGG
jgi:hypothetical protein